MKAVSVLALVVGMSVMAQAEKPAASPACESLVKSCEGAGFKVGDHKKGGKGVWADCVAVIAHGGTVTGVTATKDEAKACMDAAKAMKHH